MRGKPINFMLGGVDRTTVYFKQTPSFKTTLSTADVLNTEGRKGLINSKQVSLRRDD